VGRRSESAGFYGFDPASSVCRLNMPVETRRVLLSSGSRAERLLDASVIHVKLLKLSLTKLEICPIIFDDVHCLFQYMVRACSANSAMHLLLRINDR
jgi:hypothetical protein